MPRYRRYDDLPLPLISVELLLPHAVYACFLSPHIYAICYMFYACHDYATLCRRLIFRRRPCFDTVVTLPLRFWPYITLILRCLIATLFMLSYGADYAAV